MNHLILLEKSINGNYKKIKLEDVQPEIKGEIQLASNAFFIKDSKKKSFLYYLMNILLSFFIYCFCSFGIFELLNINYNILNQWYLVTSVLFTFIISFKLYFYTKVDNKKLVLDRLNGYVTLPMPFPLKQETINFKQLQALKKSSGTADDYEGGEIVLKLYLKGKYSNFKYLLDIVYTEMHVTQYKYLDSSNIESYWRFIVWYMDKNRPLPLGSAFDAFREKDFERRKKAGFPKPLFPATFDTPEATPEQQAERELIGGW